MRKQSAIWAAATAIPIILAASPASAEDFTFEIPLEVTNFAPGHTAVSLLFRCSVSRVAVSAGGPSFSSPDIVAQSDRWVHLGAGPVTDSRTVTMTMNALNPILRPASDGRSWGCNISQVVINRPDGRGVLLSPGGADFDSNYERATGYTIVRNISVVRGEIVR